VRDAPGGLQRGRTPLPADARGGDRDGANVSGPQRGLDRPGLHHADPEPRLHHLENRFGEHDERDALRHDACRAQDRLNRWVMLTSGDPLASANAVRRELAAVDPAVPASFVRSMDQWMGGTLASRRFNLQLVGAFAAAALLLAVVGVYAVSAFAVTTRTREIGIRAALGASRFDVIRLVLRNGASPVVGGLAVGTAIAVILAPALSGMLFGVTPRDGMSLAISLAALACAALLANIVPARRAARIDPVVALRVE
jgi:predicted lysophospholipase L1 biosynthesis ABC-type transport system permease subunit